MNKLFPALGRRYSVSTLRTAEKLAEPTVPGRVGRPPTVTRSREAKVVKLVQEKGAGGEAATIPELIAALHKTAHGSRTKKAQPRATRQQLRTIMKNNELQAVSGQKIEHERMVAQKPLEWAMFCTA